MYRIAENSSLTDWEKLHRQLKINIIKSFFCLFIVTWDTDYRYISSIGDIGNLPKIECRNDSTPPWTQWPTKLF